MSKKQKAAGPDATIALRVPRDELAAAEKVSGLPIPRTQLFRGMAVIWRNASDQDRLAALREVGLRTYGAAAV